MTDLRLECIVDAAAAELGSGAAASAIQDLAGRAAEHWNGTDEPPGALGLEILVSPAPLNAPRGQDVVEHVWDCLSRAVAGLPPTVPTVVRLGSLGHQAACMTRCDIRRLCAALESVIASAGLSSLRLQWADAVAPRRGDLLVLELLPELTRSYPRLCGHVRCGSDAGTVGRSALEAIVESASGRSRAPIGIYLLAEPSRPTSTVTIYPVGSFAGLPAVVSASAWSTFVGRSLHLHSGLTAEAGALRTDFDVPPAPTGTPSGVRSSLPADVSQTGSLPMWL